MKQVVSIVNNDGRETRVRVVKDTSKASGYKVVKCKS